MVLLVELWEVWIVILLSDSQLLSKSTLPGFIYAGFICVWAEVALLGPGGYIWCVNGFVMLFACDMDQLSAEKISRTDHQHMLCFGCWYVVPLPYYRLASLFNPCILCVYLAAHSGQESLTLTVRHAKRSTTVQSCLVIGYLRSFWLQECIVMERGI